ncbi:MULTISPECIES: hypothetical protein [Nostocales]|uniref:Uncharacterized protein n=3 Tax=Nostocales TaxID=1161 RepID=A0A0C1R5E4_9CYAN|nr:hypothetical protein [Tolypothrix bouteillei]KAF3888950.1 hypothetical protein DA73_0400028305 [Tolypothrix bouteillei VB521301]
MTANNPIRKNPLPLPATLARRNKSDVDVGAIARSASVQTDLRAKIARPGPREPKIVSTAHGPLKHILFCYPAYASGEFSYKQVYEDLFRKLPKTTQFTILTHPSVTNDLLAALDSTHASDRSTIVEAPDFLNFLVWAEDPYVVVQDTSTTEGTSFLVEPHVFRRSGDAAIAELVAEATNLQSIQSPLYFQGGNVLIGDDFVFIGTDYPEETKKLIEEVGNIVVPEDVENIDEFVKNLYIKTFDSNRQLIYIGTELPVPQPQERPITIDGEEWTEEIYTGTGKKQPIFHIDMFISLAGRSSSGKYRLLVGSPTYADQILGQEPVDHSLGEIFDDVAKTLEARGFEVIRNPMPLTYVDLVDIKVRTWYYATANNCLIEIDANSGNSVWLPTYGHGDWADLAPIDAENKRIWEELDFKVYELTDFHPFVQNLGSVHCIKKYLER